MRKRTTGTGANRRAREELASGLQARRSEIEQAVLANAQAVADLGDSVDPEYAEGLRGAVSAAVMYGLTGVEVGERYTPDVPAVLLTQARLAARNGVSLDTVLRRYFTGYTLLGNFVMEEAEAGSLMEVAALKRLLRSQAALFDRLLVAVSEEHTRERQSRQGTSRQRHLERIEKLLAGEALETADLAYDFEAHHIGAIAKGPGAAEGMRDLAETLDRGLLLAHRGEGVVWAWFGGRHRLGIETLKSHVSSAWPSAAQLAVGEPSEGLAGWRLTHRQAKAALPIASRCRQAFTRYADVALLASVLQDEVFAVSLRHLYLSPLEHERGGGEVARKTLRAYFAAGRNASSAAAALGVSRQAVNSRLRHIESRIERPLEKCVAELEAAMRMDEIDESFAGSPPGDARSR